MSPTKNDDADPFVIDLSVAHPARVQNYLAGGDSNFAPDRDVAEAMGEALPGGLATARAAVRSLGAFVGRTVRYLAGDAGVRQFLNIGVAIPAAKMVHHVAQQATPDARFVYVSNDPMVLAHAHSLRRGSPEGAAAYIHGHLTDPLPILEGAAATLDLAEAVGVILPTTLNFVPDDRDPLGIVARLLEAVVPGSYLVVAHASSDIPAEGMPEAAARLQAALKDPFVVRSRAEVAGFLDGLEMVPPGLVPIDDWRPDPEQALPRTDRPVPIYGAVACRS